MEFCGNRDVKVVVQRWSIKKDCSNKSLFFNEVNSQENTCARVNFSNEAEKHCQAIAYEEEKFIKVKSHTGKHRYFPANFENFLQQLFLYNIFIFANLQH